MLSDQEDLDGVDMSCLMDVGDDDFDVDSQNTCGGKVSASLTFTQGGGVSVRSFGTTSLFDSDSTSISGGAAKKQKITLKSALKQISNTVWMV